MGRKRVGLTPHSHRPYPPGQPRTGTRERRAMHPDRAAMHGHLKGMAAMLEAEHMREHPLSAAELSTLRKDVTGLSEAVGRLGA